jgi:hypothetical protein
MAARAWSPTSCVGEILPPGHGDGERQVTGDPATRNKAADGQGMAHCRLSTRAKRFLSSARTHILCAAIGFQGVLRE